RRVRARDRARHRQSCGAAGRLGARVFRDGRATIRLCPRLAHHESRRNRQIRRGGQVRGGSDPTRRANAAHTHTIGWAYLAASVLHLLQGHWAQAHWLVEQGVNVRRSVDIAVLLPWAITSSAWALAQIGELSEASRRVREAEALLEGQTVRGIVGH